MIQKNNFIFTESPAATPGKWDTFVGDALETLPLVTTYLGDPSVDCWITSPPYFNQFSYGVDCQVGLDATIEGYLDYMTRLAFKMFEASKPDANLFWVVRDTYNGSGGLGGDYSSVADIKSRAVKPSRQEGVPLKAQLLIPEWTRIAITWVGWVPILDIVWDKKDSRRGAVDRPSYSYEHILLFAKSPHHYWNRDAVLTPYANATLPQLTAPYSGKATIDYGSLGLEDPSEVKRHICRSMQTRPGAYLRSVWHIPPGRQPVVEVDGKKMRALTAFPELLAEICVNLGSRPGGLVADPFCGFGTTLVAATRWGRNSIGIDLNPDYISATQERLRKEFRDGDMP